MSPASWGSTYISMGHTGSVTCWILTDSLPREGLDLPSWPRLGIRQCSSGFGITFGFVTFHGLWRGNERAPRLSPTHSFVMTLPLPHTASQHTNSSIHFSCHTLRFPLLSHTASQHTNSSTHFSFHTLPLPRLSHTAFFSIHSYALLKQYNAIQGQHNCSTNEEAQYEVSIASKIKNYCNERPHSFPTKQRGKKLITRRGL